MSLLINNTVRRRPLRPMSDPLAAKTLRRNLPNKSLKLAAVNINSVTSPGRIDELQYFVDSYGIDVLALSELKIDSTVHPSLYSLTGFHPPIVKPRTTPFAARIRRVFAHFITCASVLATPQT